MITHCITPETLEALHLLRTRFGKSAAMKKLASIEWLSARPIDDPRVLLEYHELLLFMAAHPDSRPVLQWVTGELSRLAAISAELCTRKRPARMLAGSGLSGTTLESTFLYDTLRWMVTRFGKDVVIAWEDDEDAGEGLSPLLLASRAPVEHDGLVNGIITMAQWFRVANPGGRSDLAALLDRVGQIPGAAELRDQIFDAAEIPVRWTLHDATWSRTLLRFPESKVHYFRTPLARAIDADAIIDRPLPEPQPLDAREARQLIDIARATLAGRARETDPVTYANPREVTLFQLDRGVDVALFAMTPERRLPIESFFGYVAAKNRVPVAYGGAWIHFDRAEIGINVFDTFRGGESAHLFAQIMRVYARHYGAKRFLVDPFQFGADNEEGLTSGAYWFYHRFGFRPIDAARRELAEREGERMQADRSYRSSKAVLRRLAEAKLELDRHDEPVADSAEELMEISLAVTHAIGRTYRGDRERAHAATMRRVMRALDAGDASRWPDAQRQSFESLCPMVNLIPQLATWPTRDKKTLVSILRAKGGRCERDYVLKIQRHSRLREALLALAARGRRIAAGAESPD